MNLFSKSIDKDINIVLNIKNLGIAKTIQLIEFESLDPKTLAKMKISEEKKAMISIIENEGIYLEKISSAKNAIKAGCTNELVKTITGLTDDRIDELRKQLE